jgi:hypothetical protein
MGAGEKKRMKPLKFWANAKYFIRFRPEYGFSIPHSPNVEQRQKLPDDNRTFHGSRNARSFSQPSKGRLLV